MAKKRSESLFFKSLYREKKGKPKRLVDKLDVFSYPEASAWVRSAVNTQGLLQLADKPSTSCR